MAFPFSLIYSISPSFYPSLSILLFKQVNFKQAIICNGFLLEPIICNPKLCRQVAVACCALLSRVPPGTNVWWEPTMGQALTLPYNDPGYYHPHFTDEEIEILRG